MSHKFKRPKQHPNEGSTLARMRRSAEMIQNAAQLFAILRQTPPEMREPFLEQIKPHLKFEFPEIHI